MLRRRKRPQPSREDIRRAIPVRSDEVEESGGTSLVLRVPLKRRRGVVGWMARRADSSQRHEIELDEIGAFVWNLCDGKRSLAGIADSLAKEYRITRHEAEASLLAFVDSLRARGCLRLEKK